MIRRMTDHYDDKVNGESSFNVRSNLQAVVYA